MNRFTAYRSEDLSDTHNADQVNPPEQAQFEGVVFDNGKCVINWLTAVRSIAVWDSFEDAMRIHGHPEYGTRIEFHDDEMELPWNLQPTLYSARDTPPISDGDIDMISWGHICIKLVECPEGLTILQLEEACHDVDFPLLCITAGYLTPQN